MYYFSARQQTPPFIFGPYPTPSGPFGPYPGNIIIPGIPSGQPGFPGFAGGPGEPADQAAPTSPPPPFTPPRPAGFGQAPGVFAVDPGAIRRCRFRFVYIWLVDGRSFWAWITFVGRTSIAGYRWTGRRWQYFGIDLRRIDAFSCF